jgi:hypothetical protein
LYTNQCPKSENVCELLAGTSNITLLQYFLSLGFNWIPKLESYSKAIKNCDLELAKLHITQPNCAIEAYNTPCSMSNFLMMNWLYERKQPWGHYLSFHIPTIEVAQWLLDRHYTITNDAYKNKIHTKDILMMDFLYQNKVPLSERRLNDAIVELNDRQRKLTTENLSQAYEVLTWLRTHDCPCNDYNLMCAINQRNELGVKWLLENYEFGEVCWLNGRERLTLSEKKELSIIKPVNPTSGGQHLFGVKSVSWDYFTNGTTKTIHDLVHNYMTQKGVRKTNTEIS